MNRGFDDLYDVQIAFGRSWIEYKASQAERQWCIDLADYIIERGKEPPNWRAVHRRFEEDFEGSKTIPSETTLRKSVRQFVKQRAE